MGGGISNVTYEQTFEVINLTSEPNYKCSMGQIPALVKDIYAAGVYNQQPVICGKSPNPIFSAQTSAAKSESKVFLFITAGGELGKTTHACYILDDDCGWKISGSMVKLRRFSVTVSTEDFGLVVIGGESDS